MERLFKEWNLFEILDLDNGGIEAAFLYTLQFVR